MKLITIIVEDILSPVWKLEAWMMQAERSDYH
jgi:hypothetical protein